MGAKLAVLGAKLAILGAKLTVLGAKLVVLGAKLAVLGAKLAVLGAKLAGCRQFGLHALPAARNLLAFFLYKSWKIWPPGQPAKTLLSELVSDVRGRR